MNLRPLTREEVRSIDRLAAGTYGLPTLVLMENAGRGAAEILRREVPAPARAVIACGMGNNGGDGGVVARHLDAAGYRVTVALFGETGSPSRDASVQIGILSASGVAMATAPASPAALDALFAGADWIVDGLLGTGLSRPVEGPLRQAIAAMNRSGRPILALDLPSGLDCDSGEPLGEAVRAAITATFVAPKVGFSRPGASAFTGRVEVVEIGVPRRILGPFAAEAETG